MEEHTSRGLEYWAKPIVKVIVLAEKEGSSTGSSIDI